MRIRLTSSVLGIAALALVLWMGVTGAAPAPSGWRSLDPPAAPGAMAPNLTVGGQGSSPEVMLSWLEKAGGGHHLRFSRLSKGWSKPVTVASGSNFFANWADFPAVGRAPDGSLTAHWLAKTGAGTYAYGIFLARSTNGGATWKPAGMLHDDRVPAEHGFVSWLPERAGLRAFWLDGRDTPRGGAMTLRTALLQGGKPGAGERVDGRVCDCCQTDAALAADGPVVVYRDRTEGEIRDIYIVRRTAAGWSQPKPVHADNWQIPGCPVNGPAVAAAGKKVVVAWFTGAPPKPRVQVAFSADGGATFGKPLLVDGNQPLGRVDVALDAQGNAVVSWLAFGGKEGSGAVRVRKAAPKGLAPPVTVATTSSARSAGVPRMAVAGGRVYLAWVEDGEPASKIRVASGPL